MVIPDGFECFQTDCPVFYYENGPYPLDETRVKRIAEMYGCSKARVRICAATLSDGTIPDSAKNAEPCTETK